jgi:hypothetical protein
MFKELCEKKIFFRDSIFDMKNFFWNHWRFGEKRVVYIFAENLTGQSNAEKPTGDDKRPDSVDPVAIASNAPSGTRGRVDLPDIAPKSTEKGLLAEAKMAPELPTGMASKDLDNMMVSDDEWKDAEYELFGVHSKELTNEQDLQVQQQIFAERMAELEAEDVSKDFDGMTEGKYLEKKAEEHGIDPEILKRLAATNAMSLGADYREAKEEAQKKKSSVIGRNTSGKETDSELEEARKKYMEDVDKVSTWLKESKGEDGAIPIAQKDVVEKLSEKAIQRASEESGFDFFEIIQKLIEEIGGIISDFTGTTFSGETLSEGLSGGSSSIIPGVNNELLSKEGKIDGVNVQEYIQELGKRFTFKGGSGEWARKQLTGMQIKSAKGLMELDQAMRKEMELPENVRGVLTSITGDKHKSYQFSHENGYKVDVRVRDLYGKTLWKYAQKNGIKQSASKYQLSIGNHTIDILRHGPDDHLDLQIV